jgi:hypothetical protein
MTYTRGYLGSYLGALELEEPDAAAPDPRAAYVAWVSAVKQAGGFVSVAPHLVYAGDPFSQAGAGDPLTAARYPVAVVFPNAPSAQLAAAFSRQPDDWSDDGRYAFYLAPADVQAYASTQSTSLLSQIIARIFGGAGGITEPQQVPGEPAPPNPAWYDDLLKVLKYGAYAGGALVGGLILVEVLSFIPKPRR